MKLTVRRIQVSDLGPLCYLMNRFFEEQKLEYPIMDSEEVDAQLLDLLPAINEPTRIYLIAYDGKKPIGYFLGFVGDKPYSKPRHILMALELYVVPEKRNGRAVKKMLGMAANIGLQHNAYHVETVGTYNGTDKRWMRYGFKPHFTYLHMDMERMKNYL